MTAEAVAPLFETGSQGYITAAANPGISFRYRAISDVGTKLGFLTTF